MESLPSSLSSSPPSSSPSPSITFAHEPTPAASQRSRIRQRVVSFIRGPSPPIDISFNPILPHIQTLPAHTVSKLLGRRRNKQIALFFYFLIWIVLFSVVIHYSRFADTVNGATPAHLSCNTALWYRNNGCGLNGVFCRPFDENTFSFRCPANCISSGQALNPRAVGENVVSFRPFVVGGPGGSDNRGIYRADSFICPSAIHAGIISDRFGGCGIVKQIGRRSEYPASNRHGLTSIPFNGSFPSSYTFSTPEYSSSCRDLRWHLFAVSIPFTMAITILCTRPATVFTALFTSIFFHVSLASDPPFLTNPYGLISAALSRFLPSAFVAAVIWRHILHPVHCHPILRTAPIEKTILFLGGLWVGALTNITLDTTIPINRLTSRDLNQQRGAITALAIVCTLLLLAAIAQAHYLRLSGQLLRMLALYAIFGISLGLLAAIPGNSLRIHHYILALLLLPGTRVLTRPSLLFQGLLVGLFVNGVARWGFAGIVETPAALRGDGLFFSPLPTFDPAPAITAENITVHWNASSALEFVEGVSVIVNDVERFRGEKSAEGEFTFGRTDAAFDDVDIRGQDMVGRWTVRLGYLLDHSGRVWDYTGAGVVGVDGSWKEPEWVRS